MMSRSLSESEVSLLLRLVGSEFPDIEAFKDQISHSEVTEIERDPSGYILEFRVNSQQRLTVGGPLGEGAVRDSDGIPIEFVLLEENGVVWRLDVFRADGRPIQAEIDLDTVRCLGYGQGLSLEWPTPPELG